MISGPAFGEWSTEAMSSFIEWTLKVFWCPVFCINVCYRDDRQWTMLICDWLRPPTNRVASEVDLYGNANA